MSVYTSESPETLTDTVQRACVVYEESCLSPLCNMPKRRRRGEFLVATNLGLLSRADALSLGFTRTKANFVLQNRTHRTLGTL